MRIVTCFLVVVGVGVAQSGGTTTDQPLVPNNSTPTVGLTFYVGFKNDVASAGNISAYSNMQPLLDNFSQKLWQVSGGQVYLFKVKFFDQVPGSGNINSPSGLPTGIDIWLKPWSDEPGGVGGYVYYYPGKGRVGRIVVMPENASTGTWLHECSHFVWKLTWNVSPGLGDEYSDPGGSGWQNEACIMNIQFNPLRWCKENHISRQTQGNISCWDQILADYPNYSYNGTVSTSPPASVIYEYYDGVPPGAAIGSSGGGTAGGGSTGGGTAGGGSTGGGTSGGGSTGGGTGTGGTTGGTASTSAPPPGPTKHSSHGKGPLYPACYVISASSTSAVIPHKVNSFNASSLRDSVCANSLSSAYNESGHAAAALLMNSDCDMLLTIILRFGIPAAAILAITIFLSFLRRIT